MYVCYIHLQSLVREDPWPRCLQEPEISLTVNNRALVWEHHIFVEVESTLYLNNDNKLDREHTHMWLPINMSGYSI